MNLKTRRLGAEDMIEAKSLFTLLSEVFDEPRRILSNAYLEALLRDADFWAVAAFDGDEVIGGATAYVLAMTRSESREMFIYDVAVRPTYQRRGVGSRVMADLAGWAALSGIDETFVLADNGDVNALAFYRALGGRPSAVTSFGFPRANRPRDR